MAGERRWNPAWTVNEDPVVRWGGSSSATGFSIEPQTTLHIFHLERRPAPTRQADEHHHGLWHHRPEQESARGSASSGPRGALVTAQDRDYTQAEPRYKFICVVTQHAAPDRFLSGEAARWAECIKVAPPRQRNHTEMEQAYEDFKLRFNN